ncbi:MAG: choice-of-anchor tandem repeat GloVer-containing protein [Terriglobales bacterium]
MSKPKLAALMTLLFAGCVAVSAQTFVTLANFNARDGLEPIGSLVQGPDGNFYGTTQLGGHARNGCPNIGCGTAFKVTPEGILSSLPLDLADGLYPSSGLLLATNGNFYGTAPQGGANLNGCSHESCGTLFKVSQTGKIAVVHNFCSDPGCTDGGTPGGQYGGEVSAPLTQAFDRNFYGTTEGYGSNGGGTVFRLTSSGTLTTLYSFCALEDCADGSIPQGPPILSTPDGVLYGTTGFGGNPACPALGCGTFYKITRNGALTTLHRFDGTDGWDVGGLIQGPNGDFYGTTFVGGDLTCDPPNGCGTVFEISPHGEVTTLHAFEATDGVGPSGQLVLGSDGNLYGTTSGSKDGRVYSAGTIFMISSPGSFKTLHSFKGGADGFQPFGGLLQATNGKFYGTTRSGGDVGCDRGYGCGTIFSLDVGLAPFVTFVFPVGKVGQTGGILGQGFAGTTSVVLNGTPASFTVISDTYIRATVPVGATTGYVTVTTPSGTLTSNVPFHVIP